MFNFNSASVIQFPSGKWGFVGRVPAALSFEYESEDDVRNAAACGPGLARRIAERAGRRFGTRVWDTKEEALTSAAAIGADVHPD